MFFILIKVLNFYNVFLFDTLFPVAITENLIEIHVKLYITPGEARGYATGGVFYNKFIINL
jgi:hypothetical protein